MLVPLIIWVGNIVLLRSWGGSINCRNYKHPAPTERHAYDLDIEFVMACCGLARGAYSTRH